MMTKLERRLILGIVTFIVEAVLFILKIIFNWTVIDLILGAIITILFAFIIEYIIDKRETEVEYSPYKDMISELKKIKIGEGKEGIIKEILYITKRFAELNMDEVKLEEVKEYVHYTIGNQFDTFRNLITGESFSCSYAEQIDIANKISENVTVKFWATSFDTPSRIWKEGVKYFGTLEKSTKELISSTVNDAPPNKARIVVVTLQHLLEDYIYEQTNYIKFIDWHIKNKWGLKFYIYKNKEEIDHLVFRTIMGDDEPLTDFLIKDSTLVYGRKDEKENRVFLKLIQVVNGKLDKKPTIESYERLFLSLWDDSLTLKQVQREINLENKIRRKKEEIRREYSKEFALTPTGTDYLEAICKKISNASEIVKAVDIAEIKEAGLVAWALITEYNSFLKATINAAERGKTVHRIFAINNFETLKDNFIKNVMIKQLEKNICLGFVLIKDCQENEFSPDDFIIVDEDFCFYLGNENFKAEDLNYLETLIPKSLVENYQKDFDDLWNYNETKKFLGTKDINEFNKFVNNI